MNEVIRIIEERISYAKKQIGYDKKDISNGNNQTYKPTRIKNNEYFILQASKALRVLRDYEANNVEPINS